MYLCALSASPLPTLVADRDLVIVAVNEACCALLERSESELIGQDVSVLYSHGRALGMMRKLRSLVESGNGRRVLEVKWRKANGCSIPVCQTAAVVENGESGACYCILYGEDLVERKSLEQALQCSRDRLSEAERVARMGHWELDVATGEARWSDENCRLAGYEVGEITPTLDWFYSHIHDDDREAVRAIVVRALADGGPFSVEYRFVHTDGSVRSASMHGEVELDRHGRAVRAFGTAQDITEQKDVETALRRAADSLESEVASRTRDLAEANENLIEERQLLRRKNIALKEVLTHIEDEKNELARRIQANVDRMAIPLVRSLEATDNVNIRHKARLLRELLSELTSPWADTLQRKAPSLTGRETEICRMVAGGMSCKQIAAALNNAEQTVLRQRKSIRRKLGIARKRVNLGSYLRSIGVRVGGERGIVSRS